MKLPEGKILIPGVITHASNIVEHPELIAERLVRFAKLVGRENVIAGADCGFSSQATYRPEVHPTVVWAKFGLTGRSPAGKQAPVVFGYGVLRYSDWNGCSSGGKQGLKEAQGFPNDFDGIVAGAPAAYGTHLTASAAWIGQAVNRTESSYIPSTEFSLIPGVYQVVQSFADPTGGKWQIT